jgi:hypothetical protein
LPYSGMIWLQISGQKGSLVMFISKVWFLVLV